VTDNRPTVARREAVNSKMVSPERLPKRLPKIGHFGQIQPDSTRLTRTDFDQRSKNKKGRKALNKRLPA